jgi:hypothetical protein
MGKEYKSFCVIICLIKNLTRKTQWDKTMVKGKRVQNTFLSPLIKTIIYEMKKVK